VTDTVEHLRPDDRLERRRFLTRLTLGTLGGGALVMLAAIFRFPFPRVRSQSEIVRIGRAVDYPLHRYTFVARGNVFVYRDRKGIRVLSAVCTHLGCVLRASESGFHCPCHGSRFDQNGVPLSGPAGRPLAWYQAERAPDGTLVVDLTRQVSRHTFLRIS
jgi:cytochrome b6-f complex iron-sulfur subunit